MTINQTLFYAILSLDSYNRGYDEGIVLATSPNTTKIGNAIIIKQSDIDPGSEGASAGFYALAYQTKDSQGNIIDTTISYRGTDQNTSLPFYTLDSGSDAFNGYGVSLNYPNSPQAVMAFDFYNDLVKDIYGEEWIDPRVANIDLTGHSLGAGLAGLVGAMYAQNGFLFDNMSFEGAANRVMQDATDGQWFRDVVYGESTSMWGPTISSSPSSALQTYSVFGEFLGLINRNFQTTPETVYNLGHQSYLVDDVTLSDLPPIPAIFARHSQATLVIRQFAEYGSPTGSALPTNWEDAAYHFWPLLYDSDFAGQIGISDNTGVAGRSQTNGDYAGILRSILAYSAIEHEESGGLVTSQSVFGDTGIRAFYNDAHGLGQALSNAWSNSHIDELATEVSKVFINFAGLLALHKIKQTDWSNPYVATDGVLTYSPQALSINFDNDLWTLAGGGAIPDPVGQTALIDKFLNDTGEATLLREAMVEVGWGDNSADIFSKMYIGLSGGEFTIPNIPGGSTESSLVIGIDTVLYVGGIDVLGGSVDNDLIYASGGADILKGSQGSDILHGGDGDDTADYSNVAAFVAATTLSGGGYEVKKYFGQTSATGSFVEDRLFSIEDLKGAVINGGAGGLSIDGAGGKLVQGQGLDPIYNYVIPVTYAPGDQALKHTLRGTGFGETLTGGNAPDILDGRNGADTAIGGRGNDIYLYCFTADNDIIDDGGYITDLDTLWFNCDLSFSDLIFERHNRYDITITFAGATGSMLMRSAMSMPIDYIKMRDGTTVDMETVAVKVKGTSGNDYVYGTQDNGAYREGALIHDEMYGEGGNDYMYGYGGTDQIYGGANTDTLYGGDGGDHLYGEGGNDTLYGEAGDDFLYGGADTNAMYGGDGNDIYEGGSGTDTMTEYGGGSGNDIYIQSGGNDTIYEYLGADTLRMTGGATIENTTITSSGNNLIVAGGSGQVTINYFNYHAYYKIETIEFSDGSWADLTTHASWIKGTNAGETLNGTTSANTIIAYDGVDTVNALGGADRIFLGEGTDTGYGGSGADTIDGGPGIDIIEGGDDNDIIIGGPGADNTKGNAGVDTFVFRSMGDAGDTIQDFNAGAGETLDISDILTGFNSATDDITDFVQITDNGTNSIISIDVDGGGDNFVSLATIYGTGLTDEQALLNAGNLVVQ